MHCGRADVASQSRQPHLPPRSHTPAPQKTRQTETKRAAPYSAPSYSHIRAVRHPLRHTVQPPRDRITTKSQFSGKVNKRDDPVDIWRISTMRNKKYKINYNLERVKEPKTWTSYIRFINTLGIKMGNPNSVVCIGDYENVKAREEAIM